MQSEIPGNSAKVYKTYKLKFIMSDQLFQRKVRFGGDFCLILNIKINKIFENCTSCKNIHSRNFSFWLGTITQGLRLKRTKNLAETEKVLSKLKSTGNYSIMVLEVSKMWKPIIIGSILIGQPISMLHLQLLLKSTNCAFDKQKIGTQARIHRKG